MLHQHPEAAKQPYRPPHAVIHAQQTAQQQAGDTELFCEVLKVKYKTTHHLSVRRCADCCGRARACTGE